MRKPDKIISEDIRDLNTMKRSNLMDIYRLQPSATECRFFSRTHGTLTKIEHMLGYKINFVNFKGSKSYALVLSDDNGKQKTVSRKVFGF